MSARPIAAFVLLVGCEQAAAAPSTAWSVHDRERLQDECERCHVAEAASWRSSLHRAAFDDADFSASYQREPLAFCRGCHAPEGDAAHEPSTFAASVGVSCAACHLEGDAVAAGPIARSHEPAPHPIVRKTADEADAMCARCHEFEFPENRRWAEGTLMQSTMREHLASPDVELGCSDCHMRRDAGAGAAVDHGFAISRDPVRLAAALEADARRTPGGIAIDLVPLGVGHAFPTGDLFRRLSVEAIVLDDAGHARASARRLLARQFPWIPPRAGGRPPLHADIPDDRLHGPTRVELALPDARPHDRVVWAVAYERVAHRDASAPLASVLFDRIELATGDL